MKRVAVFSWELARAPHLGAMLDARVVPFPPAPWGIDAVAMRAAAPSRIAAAFAKRHRLPLLHLREAWFRAAEAGDPTLAMLVDPVGDPLAPNASALREALSSAKLDEARGLAALDAARAVMPERDDAPITLVVREAGDDIAARVAAVQSELGAAALVLDDPYGPKLPPLPTGLRAAVGDVASLLARAHRVDVTASPIGLDALIAGAEVVTYGEPIYAGWGLTEDRRLISRPRTLPLAALFAGILDALRCVDPETGGACTPERLIEHLALQREAGPAHLPRVRGVTCVGFSSWKRSFLPSFVRAPGREVRFVDDAKQIPRMGDGEAVVAWGARPDSAIEHATEASGAALWRMEDGFLRSVGLGSDLNAPASLALDPEGIYYDPSRPSALETILATMQLGDAERARAKALRERIVAAKISKYNVGVKRSVGPEPGDARRVVLAIGQVEDDASIQLGCVDVRRNEDLLRAARLARPHAYLMYKPHPDVVSGNRVDDLPLHVARQLCDEVIVDAPLADCLEATQEVHTMTSLVGFESLLRGLEVHAYGQPFYSGWGLTIDRHPHPRRTRRLTLDELVAATLIRYPTYVHPVSRAYTTPERIVDYLVDARRPQGLRRSALARQLLRGRNYLKEIIRVP